MDTILPSYKHLMVAENLYHKLTSAGLTPGDADLIISDSSGCLAQSWVTAWQAIRLASGDESLEQRLIRAMFGLNFTGVYEVEHLAKPYTMAARQHLLKFPWTSAELEEKRDSWLLFPGMSVSITEMETWEKAIEVVVPANMNQTSNKPRKSLLKILASPFWDFPEEASPEPQRLIKRPSLELLCHRHLWRGPQGVFAQCVTPKWHLMPKQLFYADQPGTVQMDRLRSAGLRPANACEVCYYLILHYLRTGERLCSSSVVRTADRSGQNFMQVGPFTDQGIEFSRGWKARPHIGVLPVITK